MTMKQIILFPTGTLDEKIRRQLTRAGAVPVEVDDPSKIVMLLPSCKNLTGDVLLKAAFIAISNCRIDPAAARFGNELIRLLSDK